jgi:hypothetical protein
MPIQKRLCHAPSPQRGRRTQIRGFDRTHVRTRAHSHASACSAQAFPPSRLSTIEKSFGPHVPSPTMRLPARCADSEIRHLEVVIRHVTGAHDPSIPMYLPQSYWLGRLERIERTTCLIPPQQHRIKALRRLLLASKQHERQCA